MAPSPPPWHPGLLAGLGAFLVVILSPLFPPLSVVFTLLGVVSLALLGSDARRRGGTAGRPAMLGLGLLAAGFFGAFLTNVLANAALAAGDFEGWRRSLWLYLAAEVAVAAGFYLGPQHLASDRSRMLLGVALGAAIATSGIALLQAQGPAGAVVAAGEALPDPPGSPEHANATRALVVGFYEATSGANQAKAVAFIVFAWAYATIAGRLRAEATPKDPWATR